MPPCCVLAPLTLSIRVRGSRSPDGVRASSGNRQGAVIGKGSSRTVPCRAFPSQGSSFCLLGSCWKLSCPSRGHPSVGPQLGGSLAAVLLACLDRCVHRGGCMCRWCLHTGTFGSLEPLAAGVRELAGGSARLLKMYSLCISLRSSDVMPSACAVPCKHPSQFCGRAGSSPGGPGCQPPPPGLHSPKGRACELLLTHPGGSVRSRALPVRQLQQRQWISHVLWAASIQVLAMDLDLP